jgi:lysophospholipase L1-like esterase
MAIPEIDKLFADGVAYGPNLNSRLRDAFALQALRTPFRGRRLGVVGTSLVQQNDVGTSGPKISYWSRGWLSWARFYAGRLFYCPIWYDPTVYEGWEPSGTPGATRYFQGLNAGVSGQVAQQVFDRIIYLCTQVDCDIVVIDMGTNDMGSQTKEFIQALREAAVNLVLSYGRIPILLPILSRGTGSWAGGSAERAKANWINLKSRAFCLKTQNSYFFDWNAPWVDFTSTYGVPKSGYSPDDIHFNPKGGEAVGYAFAQFLATILPTGQNVTAYPDNLYSVDNILGNRLTNPLCTGTAGANGTGSTGSVATGMRSERASGGSSVVCSKETRADGLGDYQVLTFTLAGAAEDVFYFRTNSANTTLTGAAVGDWVVARAKIETNNYAGFTAIDMFLQDQTAGGMTAYGMEVFNSGSVNEKWATQARAGYIETPPFRLLAANADVRWRVEIRFDAAVAGSPIVKVGEVELFAVESPITLLNWKSPSAR